MEAHSPPSGTFFVYDCAGRLVGEVLSVHSRQKIDFRVYGRTGGTRKDAPVTGGFFTWVNTQTMEVNAFFCPALVPDDEHQDKYRAMKQQFFRGSFDSEVLFGDENDYALLNSTYFDLPLARLRLRSRRLPWVSCGPTVTTTTTATMTGRCSSATVSRAPRPSCPVTGRRLSSCAMDCVRG